MTGVLSKSLFVRPLAKEILINIIIIFNFFIMAPNKINPTEMSQIKFEILKTVYALVDRG